MMLMRRPEHALDLFILLFYLGCHIRAEVLIAVSIKLADHKQIVVIRAYQDELRTQQVPRTTLLLIIAQLDQWEWKRHLLHIGCQT